MADDNSRTRKARCKICVRHCPLILTVVGEKVTELAIDPETAASGFNRGGNTGLCRRARQLKGKSVQEVYAALQSQDRHVIRLY